MRNWTAPGKTPSLKWGEPAPEANQKKRERGMGETPDTYITHASPGNKCIGAITILEAVIRGYITGVKIQISASSMSHFSAGLRPLKAEVGKSKWVCSCFLSLFFHTWKRDRVLAFWEGSKGGGAMLRSIIWTQLLRLTTSIHHLHPPSAAIPSTHLGRLSHQIGQTLCHSKVAPPFTDCEPERHP